MKFPVYFALVVGILMFIQWAYFIATGQVPELETEPARIVMHIVAEAVTAVFLIICAHLLMRNRPQGVQVALVAYGMLIYTLIQSPGYFAHRGEWPPVVMFGVLLILSLYAVFLLFRSSFRTRE